MSITAWPAAPVKMKPREAISTWMIGPRDFKALAEMRVHHPGGVPILEPDAWSGAYENGRLVAAIGWLKYENVILAVELNRTDDHWGRVGALVLIQQFYEAAKANNLRVQVLVLPSNWALKGALVRAKARLVLEVWERIESEDVS